MTSKVPCIANSKFLAVCTTILAALKELSYPLTFEEIYRATEIDNHGLSERWIHHILSCLEIWGNIAISGIARNRNYTVKLTGKRFVNRFTAKEIYIGSLVLPNILQTTKDRR